MNDLIPIGVLLAVITIVVSLLPKVEVGHSSGYRLRRVLNWLPLGLCYAFLYMARYNLDATKKVSFLSVKEFGNVFAVGAWVYGLAFLVNGPLTDRFGGRRSILLAAAGAGIANFLMGACVRWGILVEHKAMVFTFLFALNMYFQSFGAVSVVKVNSAWFHVRERGTFGGIFGILISLGLYFAYDWGPKIVKAWPGSLERLFWIPAAILFGFFAICFVLVRDQPSDAGQKDIDPGDASSGDTGPRLPVFEVARRMFSQPVMLVIASIEFCSGFLRNAIMLWYRDFASGTGSSDLFVYKNWGMLLCIAGIMGGMFAGTISDHFFQSRRAPVSAVLYGIMLLGSLVLIPSLGLPEVVGWTAIFMSMAVIGVHGMLSGTASADFGGKKNAGVAVGLIDGVVYLGTGIQSVIFGNLLPGKGTEVAKDVKNWSVWPIAMLPVAFAGFVLATRIWNAKPKPKASPAPLPPSKQPKRAVRSAQQKLLDQALELARQAGSKGVAAFDLDSTLFDNRPRQAAIVREWAKVNDGPSEVVNLKPEHLDGWDLRVAMVNAGLAPEKAEALFPAVKSFWKDRFFTSEWAKLDGPIPGAKEFLAALQDTGVQIAYLTGRHEPMRDGSVECMRMCGFPIPDGKSVQLIMKPKLEEDDDAFKKRAYEQLRSLGRVVAAFDNEPIHVNGYKEAFPEAHVIHLDTDSSGRPVAVLESIPSVLDFVRA